MNKRTFASLPPKHRTVASAMRGVGHWLTNRVGGATYTTHVDALDLRFTVPRNTIFSWHLAKYRSYEAHLTNWIARRAVAAPSGVYVDIGANFGWYSCVMARCCRQPGSNVVAFEPAEENLDLLRLNVATNALESTVRIVAKGAAQEVGSAALHRAPAGNPGMHSFVPMPHLDAGSDTLQLPLTTVDSELKNIDGVVQLIKIDIEGYELDALLGARDTLTRTRAIVLEYTPAFLRRAGHDPMDLARLLLDCGFELHELQADAPVPLSLAQIQARLAEQTWEFFQFDLIALREK